MNTLDTVIFVQSTFSKFGMNQDDTYFFTCEDFKDIILTF